MEASQTEPAVEAPKRTVAIKVIGIGKAGLKVTEAMLGQGLPASAFVAINTDPEPLASSTAAEKLLLETPRLRGLGTGGDPERGRAAAEEQAAKLQALCAGANVVFIVAGLGGGAGTGISPVAARVAKGAGALVLAFVTAPFDCEGSHRQHLAQRGLEQLQAAADGVICLPNQKLLKLIGENTTVLEAFQQTDQILADGVCGLWWLLQHPGQIELHFDAVCDLVGEQQADSVLAVAEAQGATRVRAVLDKLLAHPLLDEGRVLSESDAVLVSLMAGPGLTMAELNGVMGEITAKCNGAKIIMGTALDGAFRDRLVITLIAARRTSHRAPAEPAARGSAGDLGAQLLDNSGSGPSRTGSRFIAPPPLTLPPDKIEQILARQGTAPNRGRRAGPRMRQGQLPLEIVARGRFEKSEPNIHQGEDLDVPTYLRLGVALN